MLWEAGILQEHREGRSSSSSPYTLELIMWSYMCVHKIYGVFWPLRGCGAKHRCPWDFFMGELQLSAPEQHDSVHTLHFSAR